MLENIKMLNLWKCIMIIKMKKHSWNVHKLSFKYDTQLGDTLIGSVGMGHYPREFLMSQFPNYSKLFHLKMIYNKL